MNQHFDINKVTPNGFLVFLLSMSKLHGDLSPKLIYDFLSFFNQKIPRISIDVVFLYANGLYFNTDENALSVRQKTNAQMVGHMKELSNLILKMHAFVPQAFHYLPWDYSLLNSSNFQEPFDKLNKLRQTDHTFEDMLAADLGHREKSEANFKFLLEEITVTYLIRQKKVSFPSTLSHPDGWHLICYPGCYIHGDVYLHQKRILPETEKHTFSHAFYNMEKKMLYDYDRINLQEATPFQVI
jgi:hypothetical protein